MVTMLKVLAATCSDSLGVVQLHSFRTLNFVLYCFYILEEHLDFD